MKDLRPPNQRDLRRFLSDLRVRLSGAMLPNYASPTAPDIADGWLLRSNGTDCIPEPTSAFAVHDYGQRCNGRCRSKSIR